MFAETVAVEAVDWVDTTSLSELVASFARVHMLLSLFDGNPEKWIEFLERYGTDEERRNDLPFAEAVKRRANEEPDYIERLRQLVGEFSALI